MLLQRVTGFLLKYRWLAVALTFSFSFLPVIGIMGIIFAALVTLIDGILVGSLFTVAATLPYLITFYFSSIADSAIPLYVWAAVGVAVFSNILTWVFAVMLRRQTSWSVIIQIAALLGVLIVSVIHLAYPNVADWWGNELQSSYTQAQAIADALKSSAMGATVSGVATNADLATSVVSNAVTSAATATLGSNDLQTEAINLAKQYATGLMIGAILFNALLQLVVARWWQVVLVNPGTLRQELHNIRLSQLAGVLFICSMLLSYLGNSVVLDIMPILYMLFGAAGLSLIHYLFAQLKIASVWFWLALLYTVLIFAWPLSAVLVSFLALLDIWADLRKRLGKI